MSEASILVERAAGYRVLTLNRPDRLNAFDEDMHGELMRAILDAEADRPIPAEPDSGWSRGVVMVAREARAGRSWYPPIGRQDPMVRVAAALAFGSPLDRSVSSRALRIGDRPVRSGRMD